MFGLFELAKWEAELPNWKFELTNWMFEYNDCEFRLQDRMLELNVWIQQQVWILAWMDTHQARSVLFAYTHVRTLRPRPQEDDCKRKR